MIKAWVIAIGLLSLAGYPGGFIRYPLRSFDTKAECETYLRSHAFQHYIDRQYSDSRAFVTGNMYDHSECTKKENVDDQRR